MTRVVPGRALRAAAACVALTAAPFLVSCGDPAPYRLAPATDVALEVEIAERVTSTGGARNLALDLAGEAAADGSVSLTIRSASHEIRIASGEPLLFANTRAVAVAAGETRSPDAGMQRLLEGAVGRALRLVLDPAAGLVRVEGFDAALDASLDGVAAAAARAGTDASQARAASGEAREALRGLVSDASLCRELRAAGLAELPPDFGGRGSVTRLVAVSVPGRGVTTLGVTCGSGRDHDGSVVVRGKGFLGARAEFSGERGLDPPMPVEVAGVSVAVETMYIASRKLPLRGNTQVVRPYVRGPEVTSSAAFRLLVVE